MFSVAKACILFIQHRQILVGDLSSKCMLLLPQHLNLTFVSQVFNNESDVTREDNLQHANFIFVNSVEKLMKTYCTDGRKTPASFRTTQTFRLRILFNQAKFLL